MSMLQYYYTSCTHGAEGRSGFQNKAVSPGIPADLMQASHKIIDYEVPVSLREQPIEEHPPALRYSLWNEKTAILLSSQSCGRDEFDRPGNFFSHVVLTDVDDFDIYPPILYWKHPFWKKEDPSSNLQLPVRPAFDLAPALDFNLIWPFLEEGKRKAWFASLLSAVIQFDSTRRPVVILDEPDHVALWIAAVTFALPSVLRPFLTFATYHHDPYHCSFHITGTTRDSGFHFTPDDYITHFVLNAEESMISSIAPCAAADFICENFTPELFDEKLSDFFATCNARLPKSRASLGRKLDDAVNFYKVTRDESQSLTAEAIQATIESYLEDLSQTQAIQDESSDDLDLCKDILAKSILNSPDPVSKSRSLRNYQRILQLQNRAGGSFEGRADPDVRLWLSTIREPGLEPIETLLNVYREAFKEHFGTIVSHPEFIDGLTQTLSGSQSDRCLYIWRKIFTYAQIKPSNRQSIKNATRVTLRIVDLYPERGGNKGFPSTFAEDLISAVLSLFKGQEDLLVECLILDWPTYTNFVHGWVYYQMVRELDPIARTKFRDAFLRFDSEIREYEYFRDLLSSQVENKVRILEAWVRFTAPQGSEAVYETLRQAIDIAIKPLNESETRIFSEQLLASNFLSSLMLPPLKTRVMLEYIGTQEMGEIPSSRLPLYRECYASPALVSTKTMFIIGGSLAMTEGYFQSRSIPEINAMLTSLGEEGYEQEALKYIQRFFRSPITMTSHKDMILAVYVHKYQHIFWAEYWNYLIKVMLSNGYADTFSKMLEFWFERAPIDLADRPYVTTGFFLMFFLHIESVRSSKENTKQFKQVGEEIKRCLEKKDWYPLICDMFDIDTDKKKVFGLF
jgi:hypothetical protein